MAYGYNNNPYNQYNYNQNGYGVYPNQQMTQYPQQYQQSYQAYQPQQQQVVYHPLTFVNGIEGAKAFIVNPNQVFYLLDSDSNTLYVKTADAQGRCELKSFVLSTTESNNNYQKPITPINYVTKEDLVAFKDEIIKVIKGGDVNE